MDKPIEMPTLEDFALWLGELHINLRMEQKRRVKFQEENEKLKIENEKLKARLNED